MRLGVLPCQGVKKCSVCGQERKGCTTERAFIHPTCAPCVENRQMYLAAGDDLQDRLRTALVGWLGYWGVFIPQGELIGDDFSLAEALIADLALELLTPEDAA